MPFQLRHTRLARESALPDGIFAGFLTGAALGRAVEPGTGGNAKGHFHESACLNCETPLIGPYCHSCGQQAHLHKTVGAFLHDLLHGVLHFEGKIWRTLPLLGCSSPRISFSSVVLPAPLGPMRPTLSPRRMVALKSRTMQRWPKCLLTWVSSDTSLPLDALVLETDAPDMPPHWLYVSAERRAEGQPQACNSPAELPRIGAELAAIRGLEPSALAQALWHNTLTALPRLGALLPAMALAIAIFLLWMAIEAYRLRPPPGAGAGRRAAGRLQQHKQGNGAEAQEETGGPA